MTERTLWIILMIGIVTIIPVGLLSALFDESRLLIAAFVLNSIAIISSLVLITFGYTQLAEQPWTASNKPYSTEKIVALDDNNLVSGAFYLRSGHFKEGLYYQYMVKLNNGGYVANKVSSDDTTIFYDDENPRVEWYKKERTWWLFKEEDTFNKIYIPKGSITEDYSVDLE